MDSMSACKAAVVWVKSRENVVLTIQNTNFVVDQASENYFFKRESEAFESSSTLKNKGRKKVEKKLKR